MDNFMLHSRPVLQVVLLQLLQQGGINLFKDVTEKWKWIMDF